MAPTTTIRATSGRPQADAPAATHAVVNVLRVLREAGHVRDDSPVALLCHRLDRLGSTELHLDLGDSTCLRRPRHTAAARILTYAELLEELHHDAGEHQCCYCLTAPQAASELAAAAQPVAAIRDTLEQPACTTATAVLHRRRGLSRMLMRGQSTLAAGSPSLGLAWTQASAAALVEVQALGADYRHQNQAAEHADCGLIAYSAARQAAERSGADPSGVWKQMLPGLWDPQADTLYGWTVEDLTALDWPTELPQGSIPSHGVDIAAATLTTDQPHSWVASTDTGRDSEILGYATDLDLDGVYHRDRIAVRVPLAVLIGLRFNYTMTIVADRGHSAAQVAAAVRLTMETGAPVASVLAALDAAEA